MKRGIIKITEYLYDNNWSEISEIFREFKPSHIEFRHWENGMWYFYGTCEKFEELPEASVVPFYNVIFTRDDKGGYTYRFEKVL